MAKIIKIYSGSAEGKVSTDFDHFMAADFSFLETDELDLLNGSGVLSILHHHVYLARLKGHIHQQNLERLTAQRNYKLSITLFTLSCNYIADSSCKLKYKS